MGIVRRNQQDSDIFNTRTAPAEARPATAPRAHAAPALAPFARDTDNVQFTRRPMTASAVRDPGAAGMSSGLPRRQSLAYVQSDGGVAAALSRDQAVVEANATVAAEPASTPAPPRPVVPRLQWNDTVGGLLTSPQGDARPAQSARSARAPVPEPQSGYGGIDDRSRERHSPGYVPVKRRIAPPQPKPERPHHHVSEVERTPAEQRQAERRTFGYVPKYRQVEREEYARTAFEMEILTAGHIPRKRHIEMKHAETARLAPGYIPKVANRKPPSEFNPFNPPPDSARPLISRSSSRRQSNIVSGMTTTQPSDFDPSMGKKHVQPVRHEPKFQRDRDDASRALQPPFWR